MKYKLLTIFLLPALAFAAVEQQPGFDLKKRKHKKQQPTPVPPPPPKPPAPKSHERKISHEELEFCCKFKLHESLDQKIRRAKLHTSPFPHLVIENVFPQEFYAHACSLWPKQAVMKKRGERGVLCPTASGAFDTELTDAEKTFWAHFSDVVVNRYIKPKVADRLLPYINLIDGLESYDARYFDKSTDLLNSRHDALISDTDHFNTKAHLDSANVMAKILIYMPSDKTHPEFGTALYSSKPAKSASSLKETIAQTSLGLAKMLPYKPNTLVVILRTPNSWHGVEKIVPITPEYERRIYASQLSYSPEFMEENMEENTLIPADYYHHEMMD